MLVMIDNYDSFTYNVVQYLAELKAELIEAQKKLDELEAADDSNDDQEEDTSDDTPAEEPGSDFEKLLLALVDLVEEMLNELDTKIDTLENQIVDGVLNADDLADEALHTELEGVAGQLIEAFEEMDTYYGFLDIFESFMDRINAGDDDGNTDDDDSDDTES